MLGDRVGGGGHLCTRPSPGGEAVARPCYAAPADAKDTGRGLDRIPGEKEYDRERQPCPTLGIPTHAPWPSTSSLLPLVR